MRLSILLAGLLFVPLAGAQTPADSADPEAPVEVDARLHAALAGFGIADYETFDNGDIRFDYVGLGEAADREQGVLVRSTTMTLMDREVREVWSFATAPGDGASVSPDLAARLLEDNGFTEVGAWAVEDGGVYFRVLLPADAGADELAFITEAVAATADDLEAELSETDEL